MKLEIVAGRHHLTLLLAVTATAITSSLLLLFLCHTLHYKRTAPSITSIVDDDSKPPHHLSYSLLRRATNSFSSPSTTATSAPSSLAPSCHRGEPPLP